MSDAVSQVKLTDSRFSNLVQDPPSVHEEKYLKACGWIRSPSEVSRLTFWIDPIDGRRLWRHEAVEKQETRDRFVKEVMES